MISVWFFHADPIGKRPEHVITGCNVDSVVEALCDRFGAHRFDLEAIYYELRVLRAGTVLELPERSRVAIIQY